MENIDIGIGVLFGIVTAWAIFVTDAWLTWRRRAQIAEVRAANAAADAEDRFNRHRMTLRELDAAYAETRKYHFRWAATVGEARAWKQALCAAGVVVNGPTRWDHRYAAALLRP